MKLIALFETVNDPTYKGQMSLPKNGIMFQTERGSRYVWDPATKSTMRWKSHHPEHGASQKTGSQEASQKTIFINNGEFEFADVVGWVGEKNFIYWTTNSKIYLAHKDGTLSDPIAFSWNPRPGMFPLEFWGMARRPDKFRTARHIHVGNDIGKMSDAPF